MPADYRGLIKKHQMALDAEASEKTRLWWERYMKGVIPFRGVGLPRNQALLAKWREENGVDKLPLEDQLGLALGFFNEPMAEDKLAGILFLQHYLCDKLPWDVLHKRYEGLFERELIFDWSISDWFSVRVLGPAINKNGMPCAEAIAAWKEAPYLWQARSSLVPFVKVASQPAYYPFVQEACTALIGRGERFAKTAVGWVLREIFKHDEGFVLSFVERHLGDFSRESLGNALKYLDKERQKPYFQGLRKVCGAGRGEEQ